MNRILARDLLKLKPYEIWAMPDQDITLVFDDGELQTTQRLTIYSWYYWEFQRVYTDTPLLIKHHIRDRIISKGVHLDLMGQSFWDCYFSHGGNISTEVLSRMAYQILNDVYNDFTETLEEWVTTINILDYAEIVTHPEILKANAVARDHPGERSITAANDLALDYLYGNDTTFAGNNIRLMCGTKTLNVTQVTQSVSPRGYLTDTDNRIFRHPIVTSYTEGHKRLHDSITESRSGAKASGYSKTAIADTETFNRKMQLAVGVVQRLHRGDCGTKHTVKFPVRAGDLDTLAGKYYVNDLGALVAITEDSKELINTTINLRSVLGCAHPDPAGVCATCMGQLAYSIPDNTNIGHVAATEFCAALSQSILSFKHKENSAVASRQALDSVQRNFIRASDDGRELLLAHEQKWRTLSIIIDHNDAENIKDIHQLDTNMELAVTRLSECTWVRMVGEWENGKPFDDTLQVSNGKKLSSVSKELLGWMKLKDWELTERGDYIVNLDGWPADQPILVFPMQNMGMLEYMQVVSSMILSTRSAKSNTSGVKRLDQYSTRESALLDLYNLINSKLEVNIAYVELILYSTMAKSVKERQFFLPGPEEPAVFSPFKDNIQYRTLSTSFVNGYVQQTLTSPSSYLKQNRVDHPMDAMMR